MNFVLDENLPARMARILGEMAHDIGHKVLHLAADLGLKGMADVAWISALDPNETWTILTHDSGIRRHPQELAAWRTQGHQVFFLAKGWQHLPFQEQAWRLIKCWPDVIAAAESAQRGDAFSISLKGKIEELAIKRQKKHRVRKRRK